jgi:hypothetical protein
MSQEFEAVTECLESRWKSGPFQPLQRASRLSPITTTNLRPPEQSPRRVTHTPTSDMLGPSPGHRSGQPGVLDSESIERLLSALSIRGKGNHTCPLGSSCDKGGFDPHGALVIFERNSDFK